MKIEQKEIFKYFKQVFNFGTFFCMFANSKSINMATIILEYDARNAIAKNNQLHYVFRNFYRKNK